jgi:hypothetical protein
LAERQLFFWTARQVLVLVVSIALTVWFVMGLIHGHLAGGALLTRLL